MSRYLAVQLPKAYLRDANFRSTNLWNANLQSADLGNANFQGAYLRGANLKNAYLNGTNLRYANLGEADLQGVILLSVDLRETQNIDRNQLAENESLICNVALPDEIMDIDPDRDCEKISSALRNRDKLISDSSAQEVVNRARKKTWE